MRPSQADGIVLVDVRTDIMSFRIHCQVYELVVEGPFSSVSYYKSHYHRQNCWMMTLYSCSSKTPKRYNNFTICRFYASVKNEISLHIFTKHIAVVRKAPGTYPEHATRTTRNIPEHGTRATRNAPETQKVASISELEKCTRNTRNMAKS